MTKRLSKFKVVFIVAVAALLAGCADTAPEAPEMPETEISSEENEGYGFYFRMIDESGKEVYEAVYKGIKRRKDKIEVPPVEKPVFENAVYSVMFDNPQFIYLSDTFGYDMQKDGKITCYYPGYSLRGDVAAARLEEIEAEAEKVRKETEGKSDYEKELYIHDYLMRRTVYDDSNGADKTMYGALITGKTNCRGYSAAFMYLLNTCGVEAGQVIGSVEKDGETEGHSWNFVILDGQFYYCDECWNDIDPAVSETVPYHYAFFNMALDGISMTHKQDTQGKYLMALNGTNDGSYNYLKKNGLYASNYGNIYDIIMAKILLSRTFNKPLMIQCASSRDYVKFTGCLKEMVKKAAKEACMDITYYEYIQVPEGNTVIINFG